MTQATLIEPTLEQAIVQAARDLGIAWVTCYDAGRRGHEYSHWTSWRERKDTYAKAGGCSGPCLDDFEAAVLVASGVEFSIHEAAQS